MSCRVTTAATIGLIIGLAVQAEPVRVPLTVAEPSGQPRRPGHVTSGVPFPMGALRPGAAFRLIDEAGSALPLQTQTTATWRDGSLKWVLLDFQADLGAGQTRQFTLEADSSQGSSPAPAFPVQVRPTAQAVWLENGLLRVGVRKDRLELVIAPASLADSAAPAPESALPASWLATVSQSLALARESGGLAVRVQPPEEVALEEPGPLRAVVRVSGWTDDGQTNRLMRYLVRVHVLAGWAGLRLDHTVVQLSPRLKMLWLNDLSLHLQAAWAGAVRYCFGASSTAHTGVLRNDPVTLAQLEEGSYSLVQAGQTNAVGLRAAGWVQVTDQRQSLSVGVEDFWQQFPKTINVSSNGIRLGLLPAEAGQPFDLDQGLAKTHTVWAHWEGVSHRPGAGSVGGANGPEPSDLKTLATGGEAVPERRPLTPALGRGSAQEDVRRTGEEESGRFIASQGDSGGGEPFPPPLMAVAPAQWYCQSGVFGDLVPFDFDLFPDYETLVERGADKLIRAMATGWRHWGDFYYGGPYKGTNSYMNLEYDLPHNFLVQFARTGLRKYLDAARRMARHQADIDVNHYTGWQWKHSPRHTETQAEFGHTFTRGLLESWYLTGDRRCLEAALTLGGFFAREFQRPAALGNERQIGWGLIALLPVYEATWDPRYLAAITHTVDRLLAGLDARGRFSIRWDNRIAFFNGVAATGLLYLYRATGDERVADAALRVIRRTKGFYPDYAGRTLEALAWAYQRTGDPDYLDLLKLTYEATMARALAWGGLDPGGMTIFTVHALPFMEQAGLARRPMPPLNLSAQQLASDCGLHGHHLPQAQAELYLHCPDSNGFRLVLVRKGAWTGPGQATLWDPAGQPVARLQFEREPVLFQRQELMVAPSIRGTYRLTLQAPVIKAERTGSMITWDVVTARPMPAVFALPGFEGLERVTPRLFAAAEDDAAQIDLELRAEGEGFKKAVIYEPTGQPAAVLERFIDLGDANPYTYKLSARVPARHQAGLWSLVLQDVSVVRLTGLLPYFATSSNAFFRPDRAP